MCCNYSINGLKSKSTLWWLLAPRYPCSYRVFKKNALMFVCLISPKPINRFLNRFFFWKLRSMCKFWIQNQFCAILGGWDICKTKAVSKIDMYIFILTWSGPHCLREALRCPNCPWVDQTPPERPVLAILGPLGLLRVWPGQSAVSWSISFWYSEDHFRSVWI